MPWPLIGANLRAHPIRTLLTMGSMAVAVFLLCFLRTVLVSMEAGIAASASNRLVVQSAVSLFVDLPVSYQGKIDAVRGVARSCKLQWFGAYYREPSNFFAQFGVDHDRFFEAYPEVRLVAGSKEAFGASATACLIGSELARRFEWKLGTRIPLIGTIFPRTDGTAWEFEVAGIYESSSPNVDNSTLWFRYDYLDESARAGATPGPIGVGVFVLGLAPGADGVEVAARVDEIFANGPQRVQTTNEAEFQRQFVTMLGSVPFFLNSIGGAVLFAILLASLNTMLLSARQRIHEFGVLKALGFTDGATFLLLLVESLAVCGSGGVLGAAVVLATFPALGAALASGLPTFALGGDTVAFGLGLSLAVGVLAGLLPAWQASRLDAVEALRMEV